jgi:hypothetical protein
VLTGLLDACRSGGDSVINVPNRWSEGPLPRYAHGAFVMGAQERNLAARAWLWGSTLPPDVDAISLGMVGETPPVPTALARAWLRLGVRSGGPLLLSDIAGQVTPGRLRMFGAAAAEVAGTPARPQRTVDPLAGATTPMGEDQFLSRPDVNLPEWV